MVSMAMLLSSALLCCLLSLARGADHLSHTKISEANQHVYDNIAKFSAGCKDGVFLDFGSNRGVQLFKLFDPNAFLGAQLKERFQSVFPSDLSRVCAISFEPNPHHKDSIRKFADHCREHFNATILQLSQVALWSQDGNTTFYLSPHQKSEEGASLFRRQIYDHPERDQVAVHLLSTPMVLRAVRRHLGPMVPVLIKMDIEGAEYEVLRSLMLSGALCLANEFNIEFHQRFMKKYSKDFHKFVQFMAEGCGGVRIHKLDDESGLMYMLGQPAKVEKKEKAHNWAYVAGAIVVLAAVVMLVKNKVSLVK